MAAEDHPYAYGGHEAWGHVPVIGGQPGEEFDDHEDFEEYDEELDYGEEDYGEEYGEEMMMY